jgi:hypothetical protein
MFAVTIIIQPDHPENDELDEWIILAEDLLKVYKRHNALALHALEHMEVIRRRSNFVRCISATPREGRSCYKPTEDLTMTTLQRTERATKIQWQPVLTMADRLGYEALSDPLWASLSPSAFAQPFTGLELLCNPGSVTDPRDLDKFFDNACLRCPTPVTTPSCQ